MDKKLFDLIDQQIPDFNRRVVDGYAMREMEKAETYVDGIIRCAESDFPEGLTYVDYRRLTPLEEYEKATEPRNSRSQFDIARNDVYMVAYEFNFKGERIVKPMYLPYLRDGSLIALRGATFAVSPVLADKGISLGANNAFVQIPKAKITVNRLTHHIRANGINRSPLIAWSWLHNRDRKSIRKNGAPAVNAGTTLVHYLFAKYGVVETFRRFANTHIKIGVKEDINETRYPPDEWVICHSSWLKPKGLKTRSYYHSPLYVAVPECDFDKVTESMIGGLFYVVDHFPMRVMPEYLDGSQDEIRLWRILLGLIIGGVSGGEGRIAEDIDEHMDSLDSYIDARARADLAQGDIYVDDLYELLHLILELVSQPVVQTPDNIASMYDKRMMVLRYALRDINDNIFRMLFRLKSAAAKKTLTFKDVNKIIHGRLETESVMKMSRSNYHGEIASANSPGDNKFFKITSNLILQTDSGSSRSGGDNKNDSSKFLHSSIAEVGSYTVLPKSDPTGRNRVNPWVRIDEYGSVERDPAKRELLDQVQTKLRRR